jgi:hypothetical protein
MGVSGGASVVSPPEHLDNFTTEQQGAGLIDAEPAVQVFNPDYSQICSIICIRYYRL